MDLAKVMNSINHEKINLMTDPDAGETLEKEYKAFVINRCLSAFPDTVLYAQEMNLRASLDNKMQYQYLLSVIRRRKRFSPWLKAEKLDDLDCVKEYFGFGNTKAKEALRILTDDQLSYIKSKLDKGGLKKKK